MPPFVAKNPSRIMPEHREPPARAHSSKIAEEAEETKERSAKKRSVAAGGGGRLLVEPWTALGISRRHWYAHRGRYRERHRFAL
jgi:hypothetical protein